MALVDGTNCGFCLVAPVNDPVGGYVNVVNNSRIVGKYTTPAFPVRVTSIGWWCDDATEAANFRCGIYTHNGGTGFADVRLALSADAAKGLAAGWKSVAVSIDLAASTTYWIAVGLDNTVTVTNIDKGAAASGTMEIQNGAALPNPWTGIGTSNRQVAIYALYQLIPGRTGNLKMMGVGC